MPGIIHMGAEDLNSNNGLKMCTFNCKGFNISKIKHFKHLLKECDILLVQETWALKDQVGRLNRHFNDYNTCGISGINDEVLLKGRPYGGVSFLVVFSFFEKTTYCCRARRLSVCPSVRLSSVEIFSFCGNSLSSKPIDLKIGLNVREGVVHVRKA